MKRIKNRPLPLAVIYSLTALVVLSGLWRAAPALAYDPMGDGVEILIFDNDQITAEDTGGNGGILARGTHDGDLSCSRADQSCQGVVRVALDYQPPLQGHLDIAYRFQSLAGYSTGSPERMVVTGVGTIDNGVSLEIFAFTTTFEESGSGQLSVSYLATNPLASLQLEAPGYLGSY